MNRKTTRTYILSRSASLSLSLLGTSYDQWCLSRIAQALNKKEEAEYYLKCSYNYRNLYNKETAFFHPKDKEGQWIEPFDYRFPGGMGASSIMEKTTAGFTAGTCHTM